MANVDDKTQGVYHTNKGVHDKGMYVDNVRSAVQDVVDGAQVTSNHYPYHPDCFFLRLDVDKISRPIPRNVGDSTRSWLHYHILIVGATEHSHRGPVETGLCGMAFPARSVHKLQHCARCSSQGHHSVVHGRQHLRRLEKIRVCVMDIRKAYVLSHFASSHFIKDLVS